MAPMLYLVTIHCSKYVKRHGSRNGREAFQSTYPHLNIRWHSRPLKEKLVCICVSVELVNKVLSSSPPHLQMLDQLVVGLLVLMTRAEFINPIPFQPSTFQYFKMKIEH